jgi:predicted Fe-S protein YdhL (DUF1289 family)
MSASDSADQAMTSVPSPCNSICTIDAKLGVCIGCYRTLDEIASWMRLSDDRKREVVRSLPARREWANR